MKNAFTADVEDYFQVRPRIERIGPVSRIRHCQNLKPCSARLRLLFQDLQFTTKRAVLSQQGQFEPGV